MTNTWSFSSFVFQVRSFHHLLLLLWSLLLVFQCLSWDEKYARSYTSYPALWKRPQRVDSSEASKMLSNVWLQKKDRNVCSFNGRFHRPWFLSFCKVSNYLFFSLLASLGSQHLSDSAENDYCNLRDLQAHKILAVAAAARWGEQRAHSYPFCLSWIPWEATVSKCKR